MSFSRSFFKEARHTLVLAIPMATGQLGQMLLGFSDSVMVGRLGVVPLAACGFANNVLNVLFVTGIGLVAGVSVLAAQAHGGDRPRDAGEVMRHGMAIALTVGAAIVAAVFAGFGLLHGLGEPAEVVDRSRPFLQIAGCSLVPALCWQCLKQYCEALSRPLLPMAAMLGTVALNIFLSWVLIYGHLGAPALGLTGAAWATFTARILLLAFTFAVVSRSAVFRAAQPPRWFAALSLARLRAQLTIGLPMAAQLLLEVGCFAFAAMMMGWLGAGPLAAHQIAITYAATTFMLPLGVSMAVSVRVGQAVGSGEWMRVRVIGLSGIAMASTIMCATACFFLLGRVALANFFISDAPTASLAAQLLIVAGVFQIFDGAQTASMGALRGLPDVRIPTGIAFVSYWLIALPASYYLGFRKGAGAVGIWWGLALGLAVASFALTARFLMRSTPRFRATFATGLVPPQSMRTAGPPVSS